jgi:hypothetical protein
MAHAGCEVFPCRKKFDAPNFFKSKAYHDASDWASSPNLEGFLLIDKILGGRIVGSEAGILTPNTVSEFGPGTSWYQNNGVIRQHTLEPLTVSR